MASKLYALNESFRKYQIEELGCQMYLACESGKHQGSMDSNTYFDGLTRYIHEIVK